MGFAIGGAVLTEDLRNLKAARASHLLYEIGLGARSRGLMTLGQVEPTDVQIDRGRCGRSMAQKHLDMMEARSRFNHVGGEAVP